MNGHVLLNISTVTGKWFRKFVFNFNLTGVYCAFNAAISDAESSICREIAYDLVMRRKKNSAISYMYGYITEICSAWSVL